MTRASATNRAIATVGLVAVVIGGAAFGVGRARAAHTTPAAPAPQGAHDRATPWVKPLADLPWRLTGVSPAGSRPDARPRPISPAFGATPATLWIGPGGFGGYDTCSRYLGAAKLYRSTIVITGVDRGGSTCGTGPEWNGDPLWAMRTTLETKATVGWRITGNTLVLARSGAPTLLFTRTTARGFETPLLPRFGLLDNDWVPVSVVSGGVELPVVSELTTGAIFRFDGKGRFTFAGPCTDVRGTVILAKTTLTLLADPIARTGPCFDRAGAGEVTPDDAIATLVRRSPAPATWTLVDHELRMTTSGGEVVVFQRPRLGWVRWPATELAQATIGGYRYRLGSVVFVDRTTVEVNDGRRLDVLLQALSPLQLPAMGNVIRGTYPHTRADDIAVRTLAAPGGHQIVFGIAPATVASLTLAPANGTGSPPVDATTGDIPGAGGDRFFLVEVPWTGVVRATAHDTSGRETASATSPVGRAGAP